VTVRDFGSDRAGGPLLSSVLVEVAAGAGAGVVAGAGTLFRGISGMDKGVNGGTAAFGVAGFGSGPISRLKSFGRSDAFEPPSITPSLFMREAQIRISFCSR